MFSCVNKYKNNTREHRLYFISKKFQNSLLILIFQLSKPSSRYFDILTFERNAPLPRESVKLAKVEITTINSF